MTGVSVLFLGLLALLLIILVRTDLRERRIPNWLNGAIAAAGLTYHLVQSPHFKTLVLYLLLALVTLAVLCGISWLVGKLNARAMIGLGDIKFLTAAAFWVGMDGSFLVLLVACMAMLVTELALAPWRGMRWNTPRPFGPMLALGMFAVMAFVVFRQTAAQ